MVFPPCLIYILHKIVLVYLGNLVFVFPVGAKGGAGQVRDEGREVRPEAEAEEAAQEGAGDAQEEARQDVCLGARQAPRTEVQEGEGELAS